MVEVEAKRKPDGKIISWPEVPKGGFLKKICQTITLPKTNSSPLQMGWLDYYFPIGEMLVSGRGYPPGNFTSHGTHLKRSEKEHENYHRLKLVPAIVGGYVFSFPGGSSPTFLQVGITLRDRRFQSKLGSLWLPQRMVMSRSKKKGNKKHPKQVWKNMCHTLLVVNMFG